MQEKSVIFTHKEELLKIQKGLGKDIQDIYNATFYKPLSKIFEKKEYKDPEGKYANLITALRNRNIIYSFKRAGFFVKEFTARAVEEMKELPVAYVGSEKIYKIEYSMLPVQLQSVISSLRNTDVRDAEKVIGIITVGLAMLSQIKTQSIITKHFEKLTPILETIPEPVEMVKEEVLEPKLEKQVKIDVSEYQAYIEDTEKSIKGFANDDIAKLRQQISERIASGQDLSNLKQELIASKGLAQNRAKLIAHQETKNATLQFEKARRTSLGFSFFKWMNPDPQNENARPHHITWGEMSKKGVLFDINNPPTNPLTGKPELPGEPFYCNCYPVYIKVKTEINDNV